MQLRGSQAWRVAQRAVWSVAPGSADVLLEVAGLKRSGLHAVAFWLLGHDGSHALVNNRPARVPGQGSGMIRTDPCSPLPVHVGPGARVAVVRDGSEHPARLGRTVGLAVVLHQSQRLEHLAAHPERVFGLRSSERRSVLVVRDPFNWAASYIRRARHPAAYERWPGMWLEVAREAAGVTDHLPGAVPVSYDRWFLDAGYREAVARSLGFEPTDANLTVVSDHGRGSSFDGRAFDGRAQAMDVADRWRSFADDERYRQAIRSNPEVVDLARTLFDLPEEVRRFADSLVVGRAR